MCGELSAEAETGKCPGQVMAATLVSEANVATEQGLETDVLFTGSKWAVRTTVQGG